MSQRLQVRVRQIKEREAIRAWEFRQRHHSKGAWFRLREVLVYAETAWAIGPEDAAVLVASGALPLPVGHELYPQKNIFVLSSVDLLALASRIKVPMRLGPELLGAENLVLVHFESIGKAKEH